MGRSPLLYSKHLAFAHSSELTRIFCYSFIYLCLLFIVLIWNMENIYYMYGPQSLDDRDRHSLSPLNHYDFIRVFGFLVFISQFFPKYWYRPCPISTTCFIAALPSRVWYRLILSLSFSCIFCHVFNHWRSIGLWNRILHFICLRVNWLDFLTFNLHFCVLRFFYPFV